MLSFGDLFISSIFFLLIPHTFGYWGRDEDQQQNVYRLNFPHVYLDFFFFSQNVLVHVEYLSFLSVWAVVFLISPRFPLLNDSPCVITARDG